jgi:hypothetical protein
LLVGRDEAKLAAASKRLMANGFITGQMLAVDAGIMLLRK